MSEKLLRRKIGEEAYISSIKDNKFKSDRITVCLVTQLKKESATVNALLPFVLRKGCKACPDFTELNKRLAEMYGAIIDADVSKYADLQIVELSLQFLDDRFSMGGEKMTEEAAKLLCDLIFDPNLDENGLFPEKDLELERNYLIDTINSDLNDKQVYAVKRTAALIFEGEPFGINRYGYVEDAEKITGEDLAGAWQKLVETARIEIMFTGPGSAETAERVFSARIAQLERKPKSFGRAPMTAYSEYKEEEEAMDITQGKLVMAFRMGAPETEREKNAARVFSALYGGTPFSKLFMNVREKLSLCYYASSHFERSTGVMVVDSGIEFESRNAAQTEIMNQLEAVKAGDFTDEELEQTKLIIKNSLGSVNDSLGAEESWYMTGILDGLIVTPEEDAKAIDEVTREEVIAAANKAKLTTVFFLKGAEKNEQ